MDNNLPNFENLVYHHICKHPNLFSVVEPELFKNQYVSKLFHLTKSYFNNFKSLPFKYDNLSVAQISEIAKRNPKPICVDTTKTTEENVNAFVTNADNIIRTQYDRYDPKWLKETVDAWIEWENSQRGFRLAIEYQKSQKITPLNVKEVINTAKNIVLSRTGIVIDEDEGYDFNDPKGHRQVDPEKLISSGFNNLNLHVSGSKNGGFEPGTLTILIGEQNSGKSIFLGEIAYNAAFSGANVLLPSLEMAHQKILKRIGANAFNVAINQYGDFARDENRLLQAIRQHSQRAMEFSIPMGHLRVKKFTSATAGEIEAFAKNLERKLGIKWDLIVLDYLTELNNAYGIAPDRSYYYHKSNANDLYNMAGNNGWAVVTAHQMESGSWGAMPEAVTMRSLGESRGLSHRADNVFAIIQTPSMKGNNKYYFKNLKTRDGEFKNYCIEFKIDYTHMRLIEQEHMYSPNEALSE